MNNKREAGLRSHSIGEAHVVQYRFTDMTGAYARRIVGWKYDGPFAIYNYDREADHILDARQWGHTLFAVLDENAELVGELSLGFLDADEEWVSQPDMDAGQLDGCILWIGFGMRPDLTGRGYGLSFVNACADFAARLARQRWGYQGEFAGLGVYKFNQRAITVYERAGFVKFAERCPVIDGQEYPAQRMIKRIQVQLASTARPAAATALQHVQGSDQR
jgi:ribosomal-protein-alanine N-acetyltransferase